MNRLNRYVLLVTRIKAELAILKKETVDLLPDLTEAIPAIDAFDETLGLLAEAGLIALEIQRDGK